MNVIIDQKGVVRMVYQEEIDFTKLGHSEITRASHVEPDQKGGWWVDLTPLKGPKVGPFLYRSAAIQEEARWIMMLVVSTHIVQT